MTLISSVAPTFAQDVVAIFPGTRSIQIPGTPDFLEVPGFVPVQVFSGARPVSVRVLETSEFPSHPLEQGSVITDHKIVRPTELSLTLVLDPETYKQTYALIKIAYLIGVRFTIQTKADLYGNMFIQSIPHEEEPDQFDTITMVLNFKEVQYFASDIQTISETEATDTKDQSTIAKGSQQPTAASASQSSSGSTLYKLYAGG